MAEQDTASRNHRKFLFDVNNFDEAEVDPSSLPVTYTMEEMSAAKLQAHEQGRQAGIAEAEGFREKAVATLIKTITDNFTELFTTEKKRSGQFEAEAIQLTRAVFDKLFPALNLKHGLDEVEEVIRAVLENQRQHPEILIQVNSEFVNDIRSMANDIMKRLHGAGQVTVVSNDTLARGDCRMSWNDGGAERNATALAAEIHKKLDEALAGKALLQDNRAEAASAESPHGREGE